jgi:hypothetical protein
MDPSYARRTRKAHGAKPRVKTITTLPPPRRTQVTYDVDGEQRTLTEWAHVAGIPKTTLHHRVVEVGMAMKEAIALGGGQRGKALLVTTKRTKVQSGRRRAARRAG